MTLFWWYYWTLTRVCVYVRRCPVCCPVLHGIWTKFNTSFDDICHHYLHCEMGLDDSPYVAWLVRKWPIIHECSAQGDFCCNKSWNQFGGPGHNNSKIRNRFPYFEKQYKTSACLQQDADQWKRSLWRRKDLQFNYFLSGYRIDTSLIERRMINPALAPPRAARRMCAKRAAMWEGFCGGNRKESWSVAWTTCTTCCS